MFALVIVIMVMVCIAILRQSYLVVKDPHEDERLTNFLGAIFNSLILFVLYKYLITLY